MSAPEPTHPVRLVVDDDRFRRRLTVLLRPLLALPHLVWVLLYGIVALVVAVAAWLSAIVLGRVPGALHRFLAAYTRYTVHLSAYLFLAADPYPRFRGTRPYPVDLEIGPPGRQRRLGVAFRLVLVLPALVLVSALGGSIALGAWLRGLALVVAVLGWFACLALGEMPRGLRDAAAYAIGYGGQTTAYLLLLTDRYPNASPGRAEPEPELRAHPVAIRVDDELERPRLLVLFRLPLCVPHLLWLTVWSAFAAAAFLLAWVTALVIGRVPRPLHRFLAAYVRAWTHLLAFLSLVGRLFPGFVGREGGYPIDVRIAAPRRQARLGVLLRLVFAVPALLLAAAYAGVALVVAMLGWIAALVVGRMPRGLRDLGVAALRYQAQLAAYVFLLTWRYPDSSPAPGAQAAVAAPEVEAAT